MTDQERQDIARIENKLDAYAESLSRHGQMLGEFTGEVRGLFNGLKQYVDAQLLAAKIVTEAKFTLVETLAKNHEKSCGDRYRLLWRIGAACIALILGLLFGHLGLGGAP